MSYRSYVGLEIHIQLATNTKVFCGCRTSFGEEPNTNICPVCTGYPGALPALNEEAMRLGYVVARALNCDLSALCEFERKNYFYPDLPKNYQISQFAAPLGTNGHIDLEFRKRKKRVRIRECHLEEDAGKMIHAGDESLLDYNRAGTPLLEIVTEPDLEIGEEAEHLLQEFRRLVRYLGVCDGNMEEGSLRCDANVSVNVEGAGLGTKVEIKNMNSFRFVRKALTYEIDRQQDILERGGTIVQETRLWNENRDVSESMRVKESSNDYRYFPEPDLPPFRADESFLASVESSLVELPPQRKARLASEYSLTEAQADFICEERETADHFEAAVRAGAPAAETAVWLMGDVQKLLNRSNTTLAASPLSPRRLAELLSLLAEGRIHGKLAKQTLAAVFEDDKDPAAIIAERGWEQITDPEAIGKIVDGVLAEHHQAVEQIRGGDTKPHGYLVGQVMRATSGRADPKLVQRVLGERLALKFIRVFSFGGAITGRTREDGVVVPGDVEALIAAVRNDPTLPNDLRYAELEIGRFLSEEITPRDWAALIHAVATHVGSGETSGVVIATGTDTLAYTAGLLHWLFGDTSVPIVLVASSTTGEAEESVESFKHAVRVAVSGAQGVTVVFGGYELPAVNLKFERVPGGSAEGPAFRTWSADAAARTTVALYGNMELAQPELAFRLEAAVKQSFVAKVFPGMPASSLIALIDAGVRFFVLELYDTGTANLRESPFSLRGALEYGQERGVVFFCTSQQEGNVDFATYVTSHDLWRGGAIPMGTLTTESVYSRLLAVLLASDEWDGESVARMMERTE
ncbi:MAG: Asp-tRNA(Asn)/Glu-tRNA(Gln) amidotransferase subunit GatB [Spirochaetota bacterium]